MSEKDFDDELAEIASSGFPGDDDPFSEDEEDLLSAFPEELDDGFPGGDNTSDDDDDLFSGFEEDEEEDDLTEAEGLSNSDDHHQSDDIDFEDDIEDDDLENDEVEESLVENDDEFDEFDEYDEYEDEAEDGDTSGRDKSKLIFYGAVSAFALLVGGVAYAFVIPSLFGGGSQPATQVSQPAPTFQQASNNPAPPPAIPSNGNQQDMSIPPVPDQGKPSRVQVPGYQSNVSKEDIRPTIGGDDVTLNPFPTLPEAKGTDPALSLNPSSTDNDPDEEAASGNTSMDVVLSKMDDMLSRFDEFEENFVTKEELSDLVKGEIEKVSFEASGDIPEDVLLKLDGITSIEERITAIENGGGDGETADIEELVETKIASLREAILEEVRKDVVDTSSKMADYEASIAALKKQVEEATVERESDPAPAKAAPTKTASKEQAAKEAGLQRKLEQQKAELTALKAKGSDFVAARRPTIIKDHRLAGMSRDQAWIETPYGVSRFSIDQDIPGIGTIKSFKAMDGNFAVITTGGIIIP